MKAADAHESELPIVLTATVAPQMTDGVSSDPEQRLTEYAEAVAFYIQHAPVIFLENSRYPLDRHAVFDEKTRLKVKQFNPSENPERGKGYQEFEMLDAWLASEPQPPARWLKITGRYQVLNIPAVLRECKADVESELIIDQLPRSGMARTYFFCVKTEFYKAKLRNLYQQCDDRTGKWIERVLFQQLKYLPASDVRFFRTQPRIKATAGSSGAAFPTGKVQWFCKQLLRNANRLIDRQRLWHAR